MTTDKRARQKENRANRVAAAEAAEASARRRSRLMTYGVIAALVVLVIVGIAWFANRDDGDDTATGDDATAAVPTTTLDPIAAAPAVDPVCPPTDGSAERTLNFTGPFPECIDPTASYSAVFDTSEGEIRVELDTETTPGTVNNFVSLARYGYYDDTTIFRTDPTIDIIQGGAPHTESAADPGPGYTIPDEPTFEVDEETGQLLGPYRYEPKQLVMARSAGPDSSSAQFFFVTGDEAALLDSQGTYMVFGSTDDAGLEVLETIIGLHVDDPTSGLGGGPSREVVINSVTIEES